MYLTTVLILFQTEPDENWANPSVSIDREYRVVVNKKGNLSRAIDKNDMNGVGLGKPILENSGFLILSITFRDYKVTRGYEGRIAQG